MRSDIRRRVVCVRAGGKSLPGAETGDSRKSDDLEPEKSQTRYSSRAIAQVAGERPERVSSIDELVTVIGAGMRQQAWEILAAGADGDS